MAVDCYRGCKAIAPLDLARDRESHNNRSDREEIWGNSNLIVLHEAGTTKLSQATQSLNAGPIILVVGPEGGISGEELGDFGVAGASIVVLGNEVFRAAHAGFAAVAAISALTGRW